MPLQRAEAQHGTAAVCARQLYAPASQTGAGHPLAHRLIFRYDVSERLTRVPAAGGGEGGQGSPAPPLSAGPELRTRTSLHSQDCKRRIKLFGRGTQTLCSPPSPLSAPSGDRNASPSCCRASPASHRTPSPPLPGGHLLPRAGPPLTLPLLPSLPPRSALTRGAARPPGRSCLSGSAEPRQRGRGAAALPGWARGAGGRGRGSRAGGCRAAGPYLLLREGGGRLRRCRRSRGSFAIM